MPKSQAPLANTQGPRAQAPEKNQCPKFRWRAAAGPEAGFPIGRERRASPYHRGWFKVLCRVVVAGVGRFEASPNSSSASALPRCQYADLEIEAPRVGILNQTERRPPARRGLPSARNTRNREDNGRKGAALPPDRRSALRGRTPFAGCRRAESPLAFLTLYGGHCAKGNGTNSVRPSFF